MSPAISVLMTVYNQEPYLQRAIESVLEQTFTDFELLIWNDCSTDRSQQMIEHYGASDLRIRYFQGTTRQGPAPAQKSLIPYVTGGFLACVDGDDFIAPTALEDTWRFLQQHPEAGFVYTDCYMIDSQDQVRGVGKRSKIPFSKDRMLVDFITFHLRLIRTEVYLQVGGVNPAFRLASDYDLCLRLVEATNVGYLPKPLYYYRVNSQSVSHAHRLAQILYSHEAMMQAIDRRGLTDKVELELVLTEKFSVKQKKSPGPSSNRQSIDELKRLVIPEFYHNANSSEKLF